MKSMHLLIWLVSLSIVYGTTIDFQTFKQLSYHEQNQIIQTAPPESRRELQRLQNKMLLIQKYGGEEGFSLHQQRRAVVARKFINLGQLLHLRFQLYHKQVDMRMRLLESRVDSVPKSELIEKANELHDQLRIYEKRWLNDEWPVLVFLAPSPEAFVLEEQAKTIAADAADLLAAKEPVEAFEEYILSFNTMTEEILHEMRQLPSLTPKQLEKEIDSLPEEQPSR